MVSRLLCAGLQSTKPVRHSFPCPEPRDASHKLRVCCLLLSCKDHTTSARNFREQNLFLARWYYFVFY